MAAKVPSARFNRVKNEIEGMLPNSPIRVELAHARLVLKWVLKLKPDADEALRIAALSHDIERAVTRMTEKDIRKGATQKEYARFKRAHSIRSAKIICRMLERHHYPKNIVEKVRHLVENHEFGGDRETTVLTNADSAAYFEYNIPSYLKRNGRRNTRKKIRFMYDRMSPKAKDMVRAIRFKDKGIAALVRETLNRGGP